MSDIVQYLMNNYIWILSIIIVILLAIIGYFADKTNFGQGSLNENKEDPQTIDEQPKEISTERTENITIEPLDSKIETAEGLETSEQKDNFNEEENEKDENSKEEKATSLDAYPSLSNDVKQPLDSFITPIEKIKQTTIEPSQSRDIDVDQEFNEAIPVKSLIDDDLISDIDNLKLDDNSKKESEIPDLDDIELPKIQSLSNNKDEDIWRF